MLEVMVCYLAGTAAGGLLFRSWIEERAITRTLDMLINEDYVRSWIDSDGVIQLYKWEESPEMSDEMWQRLEAIVRETRDNPEMDEILEDIMEEENETDDTP
jgi:hypothetical protein